MHGNARVYTIVVILFVSTIAAIGIIFGLFVLGENANGSNIEQRSGKCDLTTDVIKTNLGDVCNAASQSRMLTVTFQNTAFDCDVTLSKAVTSVKPSVQLEDAKEVRFSYLL